MIINDKGTAAAAIKAGRIQMTTAITGLEVDDVLKLEKELQGKYSLYWQPPSNVEHFFGNVEREPWKDLRIIKALRLATDRYELQEGRLRPLPHGSTIPTRHLVGNQHGGAGEISGLPPAKNQGYRGGESAAQRRL